jgi:hypothetical protein
MAKAKKQKSRTPRRKKKKGWFLPALGGGLILLAAGIYLFGTGSSGVGTLRAKGSPCPVEELKRFEHRPTLPAALFVGRVRAAYAAAREIPAVIDQLYCYCRCRENMGHKSLLSCYVDTHAAGCDICIVEAEMAADMSSRGYCPTDIQEAIDRRFGKS